VVVGAVNPGLINSVADAVTADGHVYVFEPVDQARNQLEPAVDIRQNVTLDSRGVWPEDGDVVISSNPDYPGGGRVQEEAVESELPPLPDTDYERISVEPLDAVVREYDIAPDVVETMVNGTEYDVLRSGRQVLENDVRRILCKAFGFGETWPTRLERLVEFLEQCSYQVAHAPTRANEPDPHAPDGDIFAWR